MELVFLAELVDLFLVPVFGFVVLLFEVVLRRLLEVCFEDVFALGVDGFLLEIVFLGALFLGDVLELDRLPLAFVEGLGFLAGVLFTADFANLDFGCTGINPVTRFPVDNSKSDLPDEVRLRRTASP